MVPVQTVAEPAMVPPTEVGLTVNEEELVPSTINGNVPAANPLVLKIGEIADPEPFVITVPTTFPFQVIFKMAFGAKLFTVTRPGLSTPWQIGVICSK